MSSSPRLSSPLTLSCGQVLPNRIVKAAMSEGLGNPENGPTEALVRLTRRFAKGEVGLQITGNIMVDRRHLSEPGNVVVEDDRDLPHLARWADAAKGPHGGKIWAQINHPGKHSPKFVNNAPVGPSAVPFGPPLDRGHVAPRALTGAEIEEIILRFATTAGVLQRAGFDGVQIHAAHGQLLSQFLSGHHNRRTDQWGGPIEHRSRILLETLAAVRKTVGPSYPVGVKINSADFQRGGLSENESACVIRALEIAGVDMVEVSGGTYESQAMNGAALEPDGEQRSTEKVASTREGYFLHFVERVRAQVQLPLCITGGFHSAAGMQAALNAAAADLVGLAKGVTVDPDFPRRAMRDPSAKVNIPRPSTGWKWLDQVGMIHLTWFCNQIRRMGNGQEPDLNLHELRSFAETVLSQGHRAFALHRAR
jgi:2,4-dienoyl-CoA reductase-like NADH-dependent reductase (Old Yellow Enzyme family)